MTGGREEVIGGDLHFQEMRAIDVVIIAQIEASRLQQRPPLVEVSEN